MRHRSGSIVFSFVGKSGISHTIAIDEPGETKASRNRAVRTAVLEVSSYLGNTPTVARSSYIDPRVIALYEAGRTIVDAGRAEFGTPQERQGGLEEALLDLLG